MPFANLIQPYKVAVEIYAASQPGDSGTEWTKKQPPSYLDWWWFCYIISGMITNISTRMEIRGDVEMARLSETIEIFAKVPSFAAAFLALRYVKEVGQRQTAGNAHKSSRGGCKSNPYLNSVSLR